MPRTLRSRGRPANGEDQDGKDDATSSNGTNSQKAYAWFEDDTLIISGLSPEFLSSLVENAPGQGGIKREEPQDLDRLESPRKRRRVDPSNEVQADPEKLLRVMRQNSSLNRKPTLSASEQDTKAQIKSPESGHSQKVASVVPTPREPRQASVTPADQEISETIEPTAINSPRPLTGAASAVSTPVRDRSPISTIPSPPQQSVRASKSPEVPTDPDELNEADLPPAFLPRASSPPKTFSDKAAELLFDRFSPIPSPHQFIAALTRHPPSARSSATLFTLAENCQRALEAWQDEYIILDKKTAPLGNPPKKPATGGRVPVDPAAWNTAKESDIRGSLDVMPAGRGLRATSDAVRQSGTRELRRRRADTNVVDGLGISEDDAGAERGKRARRPVRRFDIGMNGGMRDSVEPRRRGRGGRLSALRGDGDRSAYMSPTPDTAGDTDTADDEENTSRSQSRRGGRGARGTVRGKANPTSNGRSGATNVVTSKVPGEKRKQRVKSEKRSESMTAWWAERKRKALAEKMKDMQRNGQLADGSITSNVPATNNITAKPATSAPSRPSGEAIAPRSIPQTSAPAHTPYQPALPHQSQPQQEQQHRQQYQQQQQQQYQHQQQHQRQQAQPQSQHQHQHQHQRQHQYQGQPHQHQNPAPPPQHHYHQDDAHKTALPSSLPPPPPHQQYPPHPHQMQSHHPPSYHPHSQGPPQRYLAPSGPPISPQSRHQQPPPAPPSYQHQHQQGPLRLSNLVYPDYPPHPRGVTAIPGAPPPPPLQYSHSHSQGQNQSHSHGQSHNHSHNHNLPGSLPPPPMNPGYPQYGHGQHQLPPYQRPQEQQR